MYGAWKGHLGKYGWLWLAATLRCLLWILVYHNHSLGDATSGTWGLFLKNGDSAQYMAMAERWLQDGAYTFDAFYLDAYAGRMPGWAAPYVLLRQVIDSTGALNALVVLQFGLSLVAIYAAGQLAYSLSKQKLASWLAAVLLAVSGAVAYWDWLLLTESLATSTLLIGIWLAVGTAKASYSRLLLAGILLMWAGFLRPVLLPVVGIVFLYLLLRRRFWSLEAIQSKAVGLLLFLLPIALAEGVWVTRNYQLLGRFVPTQSTLWAGYDEPESFKAVWRLVQAWGGEVAYWEPASDMQFFYSPAAVVAPEGYQPGFALPQWVATSAYSQDSLAKYRIPFLQAMNPKRTRLARQLPDSLAAAKFASYRRAFISERPFRYYVVSPLRALGRFVPHPGTAYAAGKSWAAQGAWGKVYHLSQALWYVGVWLLALAGTFWAIKQSSAGRLVVVLAVYLVVVHPVLLRVSDTRYLVPALPLLVVLSAVGAAHLWQKLLQLGAAGRTLTKSEANN